MPTLKGYLMFKKTALVVGGLVTLIVTFIVAYQLGRQGVLLTPLVPGPTQEENATKSNEEYRKQIEENGINRKVKNEMGGSDEDKFPPLDMPLGYFDAKETRPPRYIQKNYDLILDTPSYQSYPSTTISLKPDMYSSIPEPLPPIKTDSQIHTSDPELDAMGGAKRDNIAKYGDLARRFVGEAGEVSVIGDVSYANVDKDGSKETLLSLVEYGANILGQWNIVVKDNRVIFSTKAGTFSLLTPAKNGNGFFLQWVDDLMSRDGYTTTRFIFDGDKFVPVYEQQTKYVRIKK